jgi:hypothetical protein
MPMSDGMWSFRATNATTASPTWNAYRHDSVLVSPGNITYNELNGRLCVGTVAQHDSAANGNIWMKCKVDNDFDLFINEVNITDNLEKWSTEN